MVYRPEEVVNKVQRLLADVETEVVEYRSAKNNYDLDDLGKYFSALSNEANLRHADAGWLLLGVHNDRTTVYAVLLTAIPAAIGNIPLRSYSRFLVLDQS